ncbi:DUF7309 domain-containing protein [Paenibacillus sp. y28]|uniref:DUF7309 domain-containing protein n=1 Tax=Paenibacillus sp. y28 TaxID=3129110 RepID=UPI00301B6308
MNAKTEQWQQLYEAAAAFKKKKCWDWMSNGHIFGVQNPATGETGYCCILGNGGEMYGLAVYIGSGGLQTLLDMMMGQLEGDPLFSQHCYMISFDSRAELHPAELKQIKSLGLTFRGAYAWPTFRLYEPGFMPWPIKAEEQVLFLTLVLQQAVVVAESFKSNPDELIDTEKGTFLTRVIQTNGSDPVWTSQWLAPGEPQKSTPIQAAIINEIRMAKAKKSLQGTAGVWELDCFFMPLPVKEGERPYYPVSSLLVDQGSGQILKFDMGEKAATAERTAELLLSVIETVKAAPSEIWLQDEDVLGYIRQIVSFFDIRVFLCEEGLPMLDEARNDLMEYFSRASF